MRKAKNALLGLAYNQIKSSQERINAVEILRSFIKQENNGDWRTTKLTGQIKRYLSGIDREKNNNATRYFLFTLMKSGTKHMEQCLSQVYGLERFTPSFDFENVNQSASRIKPVYYNETDFIFGESYLSYHLHPSVGLLKDINKFKIKTIIMLRNPAQTIVSHYHYCLKNKFSSKDTYRPGEYYGPYKIRNQDELKLFLLAKTFPRACKFISAWLEVHRMYKEDGSDLVNTFFQEEIVNNENRFYSKLTKTINIKTDVDTSDPLIFKSIKNHNQRKGATNEWKSFLSGGELDYVKKHLDAIIAKNSMLESLWDVEVK